MEVHTRVLRQFTITSMVDPVNRPNRVLRRFTITSMVDPVTRLIVHEC